MDHKTIKPLVPTDSGTMSKRENLRGKLASGVAFPTPMLALLLAACGGGGGGGGGLGVAEVGVGSGGSGGSGGSSGGTLIKPPVIIKPASIPKPVSSPKIDRDGVVTDGPVKGANVWVDVNEDGIATQGIDEFIGTTNKDGEYSGQISAANKNKPLIAVLDNAMDVGDPTYEGDERETHGVWRAPAGSDVITPLTELLVETGQSESQLARDLGIEGTKITEHNPFEDDGEKSKEDIILSAAGVVVAEDLKEGVDADTIWKEIKADLLGVKDAYEKLDKALEAVKTASATTIKTSNLETAINAADAAIEKVDAELEALKNTLKTAFGDKVDEKVTEGIVEDLEQEVDKESIKVTPSPTGADVVEGVNDAGKLADIAIEGDLEALGLRERFNVERGENLAEVRKVNGNWELHLKQGAFFDFEIASYRIIRVKFEALDDNGKVEVTRTLDFDLIVKDIDEADAQIRISKQGGGLVSDLATGDVLVANITADGDDPRNNADYDTEWVRSDGSVVVGTQYTLRDQDIGTELTARTTYNDPGKHGAEVIVEESITAGTPSLEITSGDIASAIIKEHKKVKDYDVIYQATADATGAVTWSLEGEHAEYFEIDASGRVKFKQDQNETIFNYEETPNLSVIVKASLTHQNAAAVVKTVTIPITNIDELPTAMHVEVLVDTVDENLGGETTPDIHLANISFTDPDGGENVITVPNSGRDDRLFEIRNDTELWLVGGHSFDYEHIEGYFFNITARGDPGDLDIEYSPLTEEIILDVRDVDELPTSMSVNVLVNEVDETIGDERTAATKLADVSFVDPDTKTEAFRANSVEIAGGAHALFEIQNGTELYLKAGKTLNYDEAQGHKVTLIGTGGHTETFTLRVANIEEPASVEITSGDIASGIPENTIIAEYQITADDWVLYTATAEATGAVTWSLEGEHADYFYIDPNTRHLRLKGDDDFAFNHEETPSLSLTLRASLKDQPEISATKQITVPIYDVNDAPTEEARIANQTINEDADFNFTIPEDAFADEDEGDTLTYSATVLLNGAPTLGDESDLPDWLSFDAETRTFSGTPRNADVGTIEVLVTATDSGGKTAHQDFTLTVNNVDTPPTAMNFEVVRDTVDETIATGDTDPGTAILGRIKISGISGKISPTIGEAPLGPLTVPSITLYFEENKSVGTDVARILKLDDDEVKSIFISNYMNESNDLFVVRNIKNIRYFGTEPLDYESLAPEEQSYSFYLQIDVEEGDDDGLMFVKVNVEIVDVDESGATPPAYPSDAIDELTIEYNATETTRATHLANINFDDVDGGTNDIALSNDELFEIREGNQLWLRAGQILDHETAATQEVTVTGPNGLTQTFILNVADVDDPPTAMNIETITDSVDETIGDERIEATHLANISFTDVDGGVNPVEISGFWVRLYDASLVSNQHALQRWREEFGIELVQKNGELWLGENLDPSVPGQHRIVEIRDNSELWLKGGIRLDYETTTAVSVTLAGPNNLSETFTFDVVDVNENAPPASMSLSFFSVTIAEGVARTDSHQLTQARKLSDVTFSDSDGGENAVTIPEDSIFEIRGGTELWLKEGQRLDFETAEEHVVTLTASTNPNLTEDFTLKLVDLDSLMAIPENEDDPLPWVIIDVPGAKFDTPVDSDLALREGEITEEKKLGDIRIQDNELGLELDDLRILVNPENPTGRYLEIRNDTEIWLKGGLEVDYETDTANLIWIDYKFDEFPWKRFKLFALYFENVDEAPTGIDLSDLKTTVVEGITTPKKLGNITLTEDAIGRDELVLSDGTLFEIRSQYIFNSQYHELWLKGGVALEGDDVHSVTITTPSNPDISETFSLRVTPEEDLPTAISLSHNSLTIEEGQKEAFKLADVIFTGGTDEFNTLFLTHHPTFTKFEIRNGTELWVKDNVWFDHEFSTEYTVTVRSKADPSLSDTFTLSVTDGEDPEPLIILDIPEASQYQPRHDGTFVNHYQYLRLSIPERVTTEQKLGDIVLAEGVDITDVTIEFWELAPEYIELRNDTEIWLADGLEIKFENLSEKYSERTDRAEIHVSYGDPLSSNPVATESLIIKFRDIDLPTTSMTLSADSVTIDEGRTTEVQKLADIIFEGNTAKEDRINISGDDNDFFFISYRGSNGYELWLKSNKVLNYDEAQEHTITLINETHPELTATFTLRVGDVNDAPSVGSEIADQTINENTAFNFTIPEDAFTDVNEGDTLTYSANIYPSNNIVVLDWLTFDAATRTFSGTPRNENVGAIEVVVTATDSGGLTAHQSFNLTVNNVDDAPTSMNVDVVTASVEETIPRVTSSEATHLASVSFTDIDGGDNPVTFEVTRGRLVESAYLANKSFWDYLNEDFGVEVTRNEAGELWFDWPEPPALTYIHTVFEIRDGNELWLKEGKDLQYEGVDLYEITLRGPNNLEQIYTLEITDVNEPPLRGFPIADQTIDENADFTFTVPEDAFADEDVGFGNRGDRLTYSAIVVSAVDATAGANRAASFDSPLPAWLTFDAATRTFTGTPRDADVGTIQVQVTATDSGGLSAHQTFALTVENNLAPTAMHLSPDYLVVVDGVQTERKLTDITFTDPDGGINEALIVDSAFRYANTNVLAYTDDLFEIRKDDDGIDGSELWIKEGAVLDYAETSYHHINLGAVTADAPAHSRTYNFFRLHVTNDVDEPPTAMSLSVDSVTLPEGWYVNQTPKYKPRKLADITFTDHDRGDNEVTIPDSDIFEIKGGDQLWIKAGARLDYETATSHSITLTATTNPALTETFTLNVSDVDERPTAMHVNRLDVDLGSIISPVDATIATHLANITFDDDALGTNIVTLSNPEHPLFEIKNNTELWLKGGVPYDFEGNQSFEVTLQGTGGHEAVYTLVPEDNTGTNRIYFADLEGNEATSFTFTRFDNVEDYPDARNGKLAAKVKLINTDSNIYLTSGIKNEDPAEIFDWRYSNASENLSIVILSPYFDEYTEHTQHQFTLKGVVDYIKTFRETGVWKTLDLENDRKEVPVTINLVSEEDVILDGDTSIGWEEGAWETAGGNFLKEAWRYNSDLTLIVGSTEIAVDEATTEPYTIQTAYGSITVDSNGFWEYTLSSQHEDVAALRGGEQLVDSITVTYDFDGISQATENLDITIIEPEEEDTRTEGIYFADLEGNKTNEFTFYRFRDIETYEDIRNGKVVAEMKLIDPYDGFMTAVIRQQSEEGIFHHKYFNETDVLKLIVLTSETNNYLELEQGDDSLHTLTIRGTIDIARTFQETGVRPRIDYERDRETANITIELLDEEDVILDGDTSIGWEEGAWETAGGNFLKEAWRYNNDLTLIVGSTEISVGETNTEPYTIQTAYGSIMVNSNGFWQYTLAAWHEDVATLAVGEYLVDSITITYDFDGISQATENLDITIIGPEDEPPTTDLPPTDMHLSVDKIRLSEGIYSARKLADITFTDPDGGDNQVVIAPPRFYRPDLFEIKNGTELWLKDGVFVEKGSGATSLNTVRIAATTNPDLLDHFSIITSGPGNLSFTYIVDNIAENINDEVMEATFVAYADRDLAQVAWWDDIYEVRNGNEIWIQEGAVIDFEAHSPGREVFPDDVTGDGGNSRDVQYYDPKAFTSADGTVSGWFQLFITNRDEAPTDIELTRSSVNIVDWYSRARKLAEVTLTDPDAAGSITYGSPFVHFVENNDIILSDNSRFDIRGKTVDFHEKTITFELWLKAGAPLDYDTATSHSVTLTASTNPALSETFTLNLSNSGWATAMTLSATSVTLGETVGSEKTTEQKLADITFTGGHFNAATLSNNDLFEIRNYDELWLKGGKTLNYEANSTHSVTVTSTATTANPVLSETFTLHVSDVDEMPTNIYLSKYNAILDEGVQEAQKLADITFADDALGINEAVIHTSEIFELRKHNDGREGSELWIKEGAVLDYDDDNFHSITICASTNPRIGKTFRLHVAEVEETPPPVDTPPTHMFISTNQAILTKPYAHALADLAFVDEDGNNFVDDQWGYNAVSIPDSSIFEIRDGNWLWFKGGLDYNTPSEHTITLTATTNPALTQTFTLKIVPEEDRPEGTTSVRFTNHREILTERTYHSGEKLAHVFLRSSFEERSASELSLSGSDSDLFEIRFDDAEDTLPSYRFELWLKRGVTLDYETQKFHTVTVTSTQNPEFKGTFTLNVLDRDESLKGMTLHRVTTSLNEGVQTAQKLAYATFIDYDGNAADHHTLSFLFGREYSTSIYEIRNGNELWIRDGVVLDYETDAYHTTTVEATDNPNLTRSFQLEVLDVPEPPQEDLLPWGLSFYLKGKKNVMYVGTNLPEGVHSAQKLADISFYSSLEDAVRGNEAASVPDNPIFEIRNNKELWLKEGAVLDFETAKGHSIIVTGHAPGAESPNSLATTRRFTLYVENVVEPGEDQLPTAMSLSASSLALYENTTTTARKLADVTFTDDGLGTNEVTAPDSELFEIRNGTELWLKAGERLNYEANNTHTVTVTATTNPALRETFTLIVSDVDEKPTAIHLSRRNIRLDEGIHEARHLADITFTDDALGINEAYIINTNSVFELRGDDDGIEGSELWLKEGAVLDYETHTERGITIRATTAPFVSGETSLAIRFTLYINDIENEIDLAPVAMTLSATSATLAENSKKKKLADITFTDADGGINEVTVPANSIFKIKNGTELWLKGGKPLDFETATSHTITVTSTTNLALTETFTLNVSDVDEAPTDIHLTPSTVTVNEGVVQKARLLTNITFTDDALGINEALIHTSRIFELRNHEDGISGSELWLKEGAVLDFDDASSHRIIVCATTSSTLGKYFTLNVADVSPQTVKFTPNSSGLSPVTLTARDEDNPTPPHSITLKESTDGASEFYIGRFSSTDNTSLTGLWTRGDNMLDFNYNPVMDENNIRHYDLYYELPFDYETQGTRFPLPIEIHIRSGSFDHTEEFYLSVEIEDVDEAPTAMTLSDTSATMSEGAYSYTTYSNNLQNRVLNHEMLLADITFTDDELGDNAVTIPDSDIFVIRNGTELWLKSGATLNYDNATEHSITLTATTNPALTQTFTLNVSHVDQRPTAIHLSHKSIRLDEGVVYEAQKLADITFTDVDGGTEGLTRVSNFVELREDNTELWLKDGVVFDHEESSGHRIRIYADTRPWLIEHFWIYVNDTDEGGPLQPTSMSLSQNSLTIDEGWHGYKYLADISHADPDGGLNGVSLPRNSMFEIRRGDELWLDWGYLDYENEEDREHSVTITSQTNSELSQTFTLRIADVDEAPTAIHLSNYSLTVSEGVSEAKKLADITFTDDALGINEGAIHDHWLFEIRKGADGIEGSQLWLKDGIELDYESATSHDITVCATTNPYIGRVFTLNLSDVDEREAPAAMNLSQPSITVYEGVQEARKLADISIPAYIPFTATSGTIPENLFEVRNNGTELWLKDGAELDYETATQHWALLRAVGDPNLTRIFNLKVLNVDELPTAIGFARDGVAIEGITFDEGIYEAQFLADITFTDPDGGNNTAFAYGYNSLVEVRNGTELWLKQGAIIEAETTHGSTIITHLPHVYLSADPDVMQSFELGVNNIEETTSSSMKVIKLDWATIFPSVHSAFRVGATHVATVKFDNDSPENFVTLHPFSNHDLYEIRHGIELWFKGGKVDDNFDSEVVLVGPGGEEYIVHATTGVTGGSWPEDLFVNVREDSLAEGVTTKATHLADVVFVYADSRLINSVTIEGEDHELFEIKNHTELWLRGGMELDYETATEHSITLLASAASNRGLKKHEYLNTSFTLKVENIDENALPTANQAPTEMALSRYGLTLRKGTYDARKLADITFTDTDGGTNTVTIPESELFEIRNDTELWLKQGTQLTHHWSAFNDDWRGKNDHSITITSEGNSDLSETFTLKVKSSDNSPSALYLTHKGAALPEVTSHEARKLADVIFVDRDNYRWWDDSDGSVNRAVVEDNPYFEIRYETELWLKDGVVFDFEALERYSKYHSVVVRAEVDETKGDTFKLYVRDVDEGQPPNGLRLTYHSKVISEGVTTGQYLTYIRVQDPDGGKHKISVSDNDLFEVTHGDYYSTLWLKGGVELDYEEATSHRVNISVEGYPQLNRTFTIYVEDVVEPTAVSIYENHPTHKDVLYDLDSAPDLAGFSLTDGHKDNALFKIGDDGRIWWKAAPDYETPLDVGADNLYEIEVTRTNEDNTTTQHQFEITVQDIALESTFTYPGSDDDWINDYVQGGASRDIFLPTQVEPDQLPRLEMQEIISGGLWSKQGETGPITLTWSLELAETLVTRWGSTSLTSDNQSGIDNARAGLEWGFDEIEKVANLKFIEVMETDTGIGDISIGVSHTTGLSGGRQSGVGYMHVNTAGSPEYAEIGLSTGESDYSLPCLQITLHEMMHALGFKHPFDTHGAPYHGSTRIEDWPVNKDRQEDPDTIMSYYRGFALDQTLLPLDVEVFQYLYGAPGDDDGGIVSLIDLL